jgi:hypothetical protein
MARKPKLPSIEKLLGIKTPAAEVSAVPVALADPVKALEEHLKDQLRIPGTTERGLKESITKKLKLKTPSF